MESMNACMSNTFILAAGVGVDQEREFSTVLQVPGQYAIVVMHGDEHACVLQYTMCEIREHVRNHGAKQ